MNLSATQRLIKTSCSLLILVAAVMTLLMIFLNQFDLDDYRTSLEHQLSSFFEQPVQIGRCKLIFYRGIAISLEQLKVGPDDALLADIPRIAATLRLAPLLNGQILLDHVRIDKPRIDVQRPFPQYSIKETSNDLLRTLGITLLKINNGNLTISHSKSEATRKIRISNLYATIHGWEPAKNGQITINGRLPEYRINFKFESHIPASFSTTTWRQQQINSKLYISNLPTPKLASTSLDLPELLVLDLSLHGIPSSGADFTININGSSDHQKLLSLSGRWFSSNREETISEIKSDILTIPFVGKLHLFRQPEKISFTALLKTKNTTISPAILHKWKNPVTELLNIAELKHLKLKLSSSWKQTEALNKLPLIEAEVALDKLDWKRPELNHIQQLSADISLKNQNLKINNGIATGDNLKIQFAGRIETLLQNPQLDLQLKSRVPIDDFAARFNLPGNWNISGTIPATLTLIGSPSKPAFHLRANLNKTKLQLGKLFHKNLTDSAGFDLHGHINGQQLQFDQVSLNINDFQLSGGGFFSPFTAEPHYHFHTNSIDLGKLKSFSLLLQQLQVEGKIDPEIEQLYTGPQMTLKLDNFGAHLTSVIGDLRKTSGTINADRHGFTFQNLKASLGESDFSITGLLSNWKDPQLSLDISAAKIRAHDLIFSNRQLTLYDLDGHLHINRDGINFSPVRVRLENETVATVRGNVGPFNNPKVKLDITADRVNVLDVINLFVDSEATSEQQTSESPPVRIKVFAKQGTLDNLKFKDAVGVITSDTQQLTIFPLEFNNGSGWCQSRVVYRYTEDIAPLKVSGHTENINASILHQEIFKRKGLVNGRLSGDFYLEGNPEEDHFWHEAKGGIHLQVKNGTLRKFHGLAKVFSLLNVSQIFSGNLPDMDKEGMPFTLLNGTVQFMDGKATVNDLKITSEAMNLSLIGTHNLINDTLDYTMGVMPLRTVDKIVSAIPLAGWVLTGEDQALITAQFKIEGTSEAPQITAIPIDSVSETVFGIFKRTFGLPGKVIDIFKTHPPQKQIK